MEKKLISNCCKAPVESYKEGCLCGQTNFYVCTKCKNACGISNNEEEQFPYNISEWKRIGEERGYFNYFEKEIKFNIPKDKEDKRKLLIDLEEQVGVILKEEDNKIIVSPFNKS